MIKRTQAMLAGHSRHDVNPNLYKKWSKYVYQEGVIIQHLSPYEQKTIVPWVKAMPFKFAHFVKDKFFVQGIPLLLTLGVYLWAENKHHEIQVSHRV